MPLSQEHPAKTMQETKRKARRYSLSGAFSLSENAPPFPAMPLPQKLPEHPSKTMQEPKRKARRYSLSTAFSLSENGPPSPAMPPSQKSPEHPAKTLQEPKRKKRRYSLSGAFSLSEKSSQSFRWKRATRLISSSIAEHNLSPLLSRSASTRRPIP
jgi:hypothetical protein